MRRSTVVPAMVGLGFLLLGVYANAYQPGGYKLVKRVLLGPASAGSEYFDYIYFEPIGRRVFLSHGSDVKVLDGDTWAPLGTVTGLKRDHGIAIVPKYQRGFITDGDAGDVAMFDLKTLKITGRVKAADDADSILYDHVSKRIFVFNGRPSTATVITPADGKVVATIPLGGEPEQAVADGKGTIFVNIQNKNEVIALDARNLKIVSRWPVAPAGQPVSIAMDQQHRRLFIAGRNPASLIMMNADNGKVIGPSFPIGQRVDGNVFDMVTGNVACATGDGTLHIFHEDSPEKLRVVETVKTEYGAKTLALDPKTHYLLTDTADFEPATGNGQRKAQNGTFRILVYGK